MISSESNRLKAVAALGIMRDGAKAGGLLAYVGGAEHETLGGYIAVLSNVKDRKIALPEIIWKQLSAEKWSSLAEVHPAWIIEGLSEEPPRIIGIILRMLPSKHVRYILKEMDPMLRDRIPPIMESFAVATPILNVIRSHFERRFMPMRISRGEGAPGFEKLYYLKGEELEDLVHEMGLAGLAMAFGQLKGKGITAILNRLELKDAKRIQRLMKDTAGVSETLARQVKFALLEMDNCVSSPHRMIFELGLALLAMALDGDCDALERLLEQRLYPSDGYLLRRFVIERRARASQPMAGELREVILGLASGLALEGRLDAIWAHSEPVPEPAPEPPVAFPGPSEDDTSTDVQQLA